MEKFLLKNTFIEGNMRGCRPDSRRKFLEVCRLGEIRAFILLVFCIRTRANTDPWTIVDSVYTSLLLPYTCRPWQICLFSAGHCKPICCCLFIYSKSHLKEWRQDYDHDHDRGLMVRDMVKSNLIHKVSKNYKIIFHRTIPTC